MAQTILITGGAGFIGTHFLRSLAEQGHKVILLDNLLPQVHTSGDFTPEQKEKAVCVSGDVRDIDILRQIAREHPDIDTIVHLAAMTGTGQSMYALRDYDGVNSGGTATLLEALPDRRDGATGFSNVRRFVLASSRAIYGEGAYRPKGEPNAPLVYPPPRTAERLARQEWGFVDAEGRELEPVPTPEDAPPQPNSFYGATKLVQEVYVRTMLDAAGIPSTLLRFQNVFGPGQSLKNPYTGVIGIFYSQIAGGRGLEIYEDGEVTRDFVYVSDIVDALSAAVSRDAPGTFNVGTGEFTRLGDVARWLCEALGRDVPITCRGTYRVGDIRHNASDLTRAHAALGYTPKVTVRDGLNRYVQWAQSQTPMDEAAIAGAARALQEAGLSKP